MLKILQARLQQHENHELPDVQAGFRKGRGTKDQIANIHRIIETAREFQKTFHFSSIQSLSHVRLFVTPWITARQASLSITNSRSSLKLVSIESLMPTNHLILCHPLLLLPSIFPSIRVFSNVLAFSMIQWMLAIWSLVPLPFLNPAWTSGSSCIPEAWLGEFWALLY